jgi:putative transcription antitermination factor YqgF
VETSHDRQTDGHRSRAGADFSDPLRLVARELAIIKRKSKREDFERIHSLAAEQGVVAFVIGVPQNLDARPGTHLQAETVLRWVEKFKATTMLPIILWDEQMSSADAQEISRRHKRRYDEPIDDLAARVILQSYLDAIRDGLEPAPNLGSTSPREESHP